MRSVMWMTMMLGACSVVPRPEVDPDAQRFADLEAEVEALKLEVRALQLDAVQDQERPEALPTTRSVESVGVVEHRCLEVEQVDELISNVDEMAHMGRALLHRGPDGEFDGYRLSAIRRGTPADVVGIHNGDVVHSVNDVQLTSVQAAMEAYRSVEQASLLELGITRRGAPMLLRYSLEGGCSTL